MKLIRFSIVALLVTFSMQFAKAQVRVGANIHIGYNSPQRVVYAPSYYEPAPVYYERPVYVRRPVYYRPGYRGVMYRRPYYRQDFYRGPRFHGRGHGHAYGRRW